MAKRLSSQLFISRLSFYTTNEQLKALFSPFGFVTEARLVRDPKTQRPKGFGFVTFKSEVEAHKALKAMNGRKLIPCDTKLKHPWFPGRTPFCPRCRETGKKKRFFQTQEFVTREN